MAEQKYEGLEDALEGRKNIYFPAFMQERVRGLLEKATDEEAVIGTSMLLWKYIPGLSEKEALRLCQNYRSQDRKQQIECVKRLVEGLKPYYEVSRLIVTNPGNIPEIEEEITRLQGERARLEIIVKDYAERQNNISDKKIFGLFKKKATNPETEKVWNGMTENARKCTMQKATEINQLRERKSLYERADAFRKSPEYDRTLRERKAREPDRGVFQENYDLLFKPELRNTRYANKQEPSQESIREMIEAAIGQLKGSAGLSKDEIEAIIQKAISQSSKPGVSREEVERMFRELMRARGEPGKQSNLAPESIPAETGKPDDPHGGIVEF